jgi:hypothetical protein
MCGGRFSNWSFAAAANVSVSEIAADGTITIPDSPKREVLDAVAILKPLLTHPSRWIADTATDFKNGTVAFNSINLATVVNFPDAALDFGIVPFPKVFENQTEYYNTVSYAQLGCFSLPRTVEKDARNDWTANGFDSAYEQVAYILEAFAYLSVDTVQTAFYDQVLRKQTVQDPDSLANLEICLDSNNWIIDPVCIFNFGKLGYSWFYELTPSSVWGTDLQYDGFATYYAEHLDSAKTALEEYLLIQELT